MILVGVLRRGTLMAESFAGAPAPRTVRSIAANIALPGNPGNRITKNPLSKARSLSSQNSEQHPLVCSTQGITPKPWISGLAHWGG